VQIATGEEHGTGSPRAAETGLFPHMDTGPGNNRQDSHAAAAEHAVGIVDADRTVNSAAVRANVT